MTYFVGIDQATLTGYGVLDDQGVRLVSGCWDLSMRPGEGAGMRYVRFVGMFRQLLDHLGIDHKNGLLFYEQPVQYGEQRGVSRGADVGSALVGHITYQCEVRHIAYAQVANATAKKFSGMGGKAKKVDMVIAANQRWNLALPIVYHEDGPKGPRPPTFPGGGDNIADSLWIAEAGRKMTLGL